jgi:hypothetical protein
VQRLRASADRYAGVGMETAAFASGRSCSRSWRYRRAGVAAWSRYAKLVVVQTQDKAEMRASVTRGGGGGGKLAVGGAVGAGGRRRRDRLLPVAAGVRALERTARAGTCTRLRGRGRETGRWCWWWYGARRAGLEGEVAAVQAVIPQSAERAKASHAVRAHE